MEGIIFDIKRFAIHDGPGIRQTIFLKGCPLSCWWCHNPESRAAGIQNYQGLVCDQNELRQSKTLGQKVRVDDMVDSILKDKVFYDHSGGGVSFSGGEPMLQIDFLEELLKRSKRENIHTVVDTSGYVKWKNFERIIPFTDLFLYDIKHLDEKKHRKNTGVSNRIILENLVNLNMESKDIYLRFPLVPEVNDEDEHINRLGDFVGSLEFVKQVNILPYHNLGTSKHIKFGLKGNEKKTNKPDEEKVIIIKSILESKGLKVIIGG